MSRTLGQVAFEAYRERVRVAWTGEPIPPWDQLTNGEPARAGWEAAALAVVHADAGLDPPQAYSGAATRHQVIGDSRWRPTSDFLPVEPQMVATGGATVFEPLPPVGEATVQQARESVPVEAEQDDGADDAVECDHPGCTIRHND